MEASNFLPIVFLVILAIWAKKSVNNKPLSVEDYGYNLDEEQINQK